MKNVINLCLVFLGFILYLVSLGLIFFIVLSMYDRLGKNIFESYHIFLPFIVFIIFYIINILFNHKNNIFYNLTSFVVFLTICFICVRAIFDKNMLLNEIMGYQINFSYFNDFLPFMKLMVYGLSLSNLFFLFNVKNNVIREEKIARKIELI